MTFMTEERLMIQQAAREFTEREVIPVANELDKLQGEIPLKLRDKLSEMGYFGILIPEQYGGLGLGVSEYMIIVEELARGWMSVASIVARGNGMIGWQHMSDHQKKQYLPRIATGEFLGAFAMSEPGTGSDVSGLKTRADRDGDSYVLNGSKFWCTFAKGSDYLVVVARTKPVNPKKKYDGISMFLIPKKRGTFPPGVEGTPIPKIGYFGWQTWELAFHNCRIPKENLIGEEGHGFKYSLSGLEVARAHTAARSIGLARGGLEDAIKYAKERVQFDKPISHFQVIRFKIAKMATEIEAARQLLYYVCDKLDTNVRCDTEAAMVKYLASEMSERVTSEALQIHGGAGYTKLFAVERYWRDARLTKIFEGTSEIQLRVISDNLLGREGR